MIPNRRRTSNKTMMQPNELRVGNIVKKGCEWFVADFITIQCANNYEGIPITPEILEKIGFNQHPQSNEYWTHFTLKSGFYISKWVAGKPMAGFEEKDKFYYGEMYLKVDYLHELQNLYFVFYKKELEIKL